jgi:hypothetical protein
MIMVDIDIKYPRFWGTLASKFIKNPRLWQDNLVHVVF